MSALIIILHIIVCLILIFAVLLQSGKAADLAGAFGGGGSQTAFGGRGSATLLSKVTTASAIIFMLTSLGLWIVSGRGASSVVGGEKAPALRPRRRPPRRPPSPRTRPRRRMPAAAARAEDRDDRRPPPRRTPVEKK
ncbi:MAG: preprotein translocase subunit SecG [Comamonadaceae bacterium]|nr:preprotein translocase subunit SecG [Comamonadaceae bacterium]